MTPNGFSIFGASTQDAKVLVVDDSILNLEFLEALLTGEGYEVVKAHDGVEALERVETESPDIVLLDVMMPRMDGFEVCRRLKSREATRFLPIVMITSLDEVEDKVRGLEVGTDDFLPKPFNKIELLARVKSLLRMRSLVRQLDNAENVIFALARAVEAKDRYTEGHSERVAVYSVNVARAIGMNESDLLNFRIGGILHDIGKIGVRDAILNKPGKLTPEEFEEMKLHTVIGEEICRPLNCAKPVLGMIRWHHEKMDGSGYPDGLRGEAIPIEARVVGMADMYDALTTARAYRKALSPETAFEILREEADRGWWDPWLLQKTIQLFRDEGQEEQLEFYRSLRQAVNG